MAGANKGSVLIVDDDESLLGLFGKVLTRSGFDVMTAVKLPDARACLSQRPFDVVVYDLSIAGTHHLLQFVSAARAQNPQVSILIISGYTPENIASQIEHLGFDLLEKPFLPPDLVKRISLLVKHKAA
jgi:DNA-binding NtrC family response regulator